MNVLIQCLAAALTLTSIQGAQRISAEAHREERTVEEANQLLELALTDYTHPGGLEASIRLFVSNIAGVDELRIEDAQSGGSGDWVYIVFNAKTMEEICIAKTFREHSRGFLLELFSFQFLERARLDHFSQPELLGVGKCDVGNGCRFLLLETVAPGRCLADLCNDVAKHPIHSSARKKAFELLLDGVRLCGKSLASLHSYLPEKAGPLPDNVKKTLHGDLEATIAELNAHPEIGIDAAKLSNYIEQAIRNFDAEPRPPALTYGDVKWMHPFFVPGASAITWIDPTSLSFSIGKEGQPVGLPTRDFFGFLNEINERETKYSLNEDGTVSTREFLSKEEAQTLREAFKSAYVQGGGMLPTPNQLEIGSLLFELRSISWMTDPITPPFTEPMKTSFGKRVERIYAKFKSKT